MRDLFRFIDNTQFMPHGHCYLWKPSLVWLHGISDTLILLSYLVLPFVFMHVLKKSKQKIPSSSLFLVMGLFITLTGLTHFMDVINIWNTNYWASGLIKAFTALLSITAVILLIPAIPRVLKVPTSLELQNTIRQLKLEVRRCEDLEKKLVRQEKLASLGSLTAGIAHEIKNPLNLINNSADLIGDTIEDSLKPLIIKFEQSDKEVSRAEIMEELNNLTALSKIVMNNSDRADLIVKNMLKQCRSGKESMEPTNLKKLIEDNYNFSYHSMRSVRPIIVNSNLDLDEIDDVEVVSQDLGRAIINILDNSFYSMYQKLNQLGENNFTANIAIKLHKGPNDTVKIDIIDNGEGVPEKLHKKIFEPFFTTKSGGDGSGLGLSMIHEIIVKQHHGIISVNSKEKEYTRISISLPVHQKNPKTSVA
jgi:two-component system, NtrC family, sensor kinase